MIGAPFGSTAATQSPVLQPERAQPVDQLIRSGQELAGRERASVRLDQSWMLRVMLCEVPETQFRHQAPLLIADCRSRSGLKNESAPHRKLRRDESYNSFDPRSTACVGSVCTSLMSQLHLVVVLTITNLHKRYGGQTVLDGINWFLPEGARVGLVGANGSGKSTLLRMIAGQVEPDDGSIVVPKNCTVGYLPQEVFGITGHTVLEHALGAFAEVRALEAECRRVEHELAETPATIHATMR